MSAEFTVGWLSLNSASTKHYKLSQIDLPTNAEVTDDSSGTIYAEHLSLTGLAPVASGTTGAIGSLLTQLGLNGQCIGIGKSITSADLIHRKLGTCDAPLGISPNLRHRISKGLGVIDTLTAARNADATLSWMIHALSDNGGSPVSITNGVQQPTPLVNERYRLAISKIAGVQFPQIDSISLAYNIELTQKDPALTGQISPEDVGVLAVRPVLTLQGKDLSQVRASLIELTGNAATHLNTTIQLARLESSASYYDFGENQHIELTIAGLAVPANLASASARARANNTIVLTSAFDGSSVPVITTVGTSISLSP